MPDKKTEKYWYSLGRRKTAIARVKLIKGSGKVTINEEPIAQPNRNYIEPLKLTGSDKNFDIIAKVYGGGISSQSEAIRLGVARALVLFNNDFHLSLKKAGMLTRDPRMKERKKPGLKGARRAPQWQKR